MSYAYRRRKKHYRLVKKELWGLDGVDHDVILEQVYVRYVRDEQCRVQSERRGREERSADSCS